MLDENRNVTEAAMEVGYESISQFTRDYRKMFGASPKEDIRRLSAIKNAGYIENGRWRNRQILCINRQAGEKIHC